MDNIGIKAPNTTVLFKERTLSISFFLSFPFLTYITEFYLSAVKSQLNHREQGEINGLVAAVVLFSQLLLNYKQFPESSLQKTCCSLMDVRYSHLAFDVFFKKLFVHRVHLDLVSVIVVVNHVAAEL